MEQHIIRYVDNLILLCFIILRELEEIEKMLVKKCKIGSTLANDMVVCFKRIEKTEHFCDLCEIHGCIVDCKLSYYLGIENIISNYMYIPRNVIKKV